MLCSYFLHAKACLKLIPSRKGRDSKIVTVSTKGGYLSTKRQSMSHSKKELVTSLFRVLVCSLVKLSKASAILAVL